MDTTKFYRRGNLDIESKFISKKGVEFLEKKNVLLKF